MRRAPIIALAVVQLVFAGALVVVVLRMVDMSGQLATANNRVAALEQALRRVGVDPATVPASPAPTAPAARPSATPSPAERPAPTPAPAPAPRPSATPTRSATPPPSPSPTRSATPSPSPSLICLLGRLCPL